VLSPSEIDDDFNYTFGTETRRVITVEPAPLTALDYESLVSAGQDLAITNAKNKAKLGELVNIVTEKWGDERVDDYSKDIFEGDISARTLRSYRHVVTYYGSAAHVCRYIDQRVGWSVLRDTAAHFGDTGKAEAAAFLEHVMSSGITTYNETMRTLKGGDATPKAPSLADDLAAKLARVLDAVDGVPEMLDAAADDIATLLQMTSPLKAGRNTEADDYRAKAQAIRDALAMQDAAVTP
jgi:hypothetical protein